MAIYVSLNLIQIYRDGREQFFLSSLVLVWKVKLHHGILSFNQSQSVNMTMVICNFYTAIQCLHIKSKMLYTFYK